MCVTFIPMALSMYFNVNNFMYLKIYVLKFGCGSEAICSNTVQR